MPKPLPALCDEVQMRTNLIESLGQEFCSTLDAFLAVVRIVLEEHAHDNAPPIYQILCLRIEDRGAAHTAPERAYEENDWAQRLDHNTWRDITPAQFPNPRRRCWRQATNKESVSRFLTPVTKRMDGNFQIARNMCSVFRAV